MAYTASGMSAFASTSVFRGILTIRSSGPQLADGGSGSATSEMSVPMTAKSPPSSSQISGHPWHANVRAPSACGSGPSRLINIPNYYYSNVHCQPLILIIIQCAGKQLPQFGCLPCCPHLAGGTGATPHFHDPFGGNVWVVPGHDQPGGARTSESITRYPAPNMRPSGN